ncbi:hypothetical protein MA16_Dca004188 [Dendrobium catenatum]|uniref:Transposase-associated domain-containing protein n=1 Tax=Dendrobium catenatum TaxID=906689 RepID=A0A2I0X2N9_9ASPA|nr:hypothetical protein MA16_Dca004188 [Dendrobium catenatum]
MILCPRRDYGNGICRTRDDVEAHFLWRGFKPGYYNWTAHGENSFKMTLDHISSLLIMLMMTWKVY